MDERIRLEVITPERILLSEDVYSTLIPGVEGEFQVYAGHTPFLTDLAVGRIVYMLGGSRSSLCISGGFCEVTPSRILVLARTAETPEMIDRARAEAARDRAKKRLAEKKAAPIDEARAKLALLRATARIETASLR